MTPKHQSKLAYMTEKLADLYAMDPMLAMQIVGEATDKAKRLRNRLTVPADAERVEFVQDAGPTVEFTGRKLWGKDKDGYSTELWITLSGEWVLLRLWPGGNRAWTFIGDEREPAQVLAVTGYAEWGKALAKGMGWSLHREVE